MKDKVSIFFIVLIGLVLYGLTIHGVWGNPGALDIKGKLDQPAKPFELSPERGRYSHVYSLAENHTYELTKDWAIVDYPDVGIYKGKFYSFFAPGISYMAVIFYLLGRGYDLGQVFSFFMISLFSIGALLCLYKISRNILELPVWTSLFSVFVFAFSSTAWGYAVTLYQHHVTTFLILFSFYSTWKFAKNEKWSFVWATFVGLSYALAIFIDYPNAILLLPVMTYFISTLFDLKKENETYSLSIRWVGGVALVAFLVLISFQFYHNSRFYGGWKNLAGGIPSYHIATTTAVASIQTAEPSQKDVVGFFTEERVPMSFYTLVLSPDRGLFFFCPIFLLALVGIYGLRKKFNREHLVLLSLILVNVFLYSSWGDPWGGWAFGPRYLIPSMSVLSLFVAIFISISSLSLLRKFLALILALFGSFVSLLGVLTTNAIPTYSEGLLLPAKKYNYLLNIDFLKNGQSNSFLFNSYFSKVLTLTGYYIFIYGFLVLLLILILFILPIFENKK